MQFMAVIYLRGELLGVQRGSSASNHSIPCPINRLFVISVCCVQPRGELQQHQMARKNSWTNFSGRKKIFPMTPQNVGLSEFAL